MAGAPLGHRAHAKHQAHGQMEPKLILYWVNSDFVLIITAGFAVAALHPLLARLRLHWLTAGIVLATLYLSALSFGLVLCTARMT